jgi:diguanylate cyclase (GGDEF)-like protein
MTLIPGTPSEAESLIVVPLLIDGEVGGTLNVGRIGGEEAHFQPSEFEITQLFARQASIALQNAEAHQAVWTRAETDALTGLRNRGAFEQDFATFLANAGAQPLTLLMLDLDDFKAFNDLNGHPSGDTLLSAIARAINSGVRAGDRVYRYGGDEFAVLLPDTAPGMGLEISQRISGAIAGLYSASDTPVTASVGVASYPSSALTRDGLVAEADAALYRAKESGGDRVAAASSRARSTKAISSATATTGAD